MKRAAKFFFALSACGIISAFAQKPTPPMVIVQAANTPAAPAAATATVTNTVAQEANGLRAALQSLEQIKTANAETLKKQEAALQQLEDLQKAADQIKIFSHRAGG